MFMSVGLISVPKGRQYDQLGDGRSTTVQRLSPYTMIDAMLGSPTAMLLGRLSGPRRRLAAGSSCSPRDTPRVMAEESTTPDLLERWRESFTAFDAGDIDPALRLWGTDPVWDLSPMGLGVYEGLAAIRDMWEDWVGSYEDWEAKPTEMLDLGNGVTLAVVTQTGRPAGSSGEVRLRYAAVAVWVDSAAMRITNYGDIDEARAAAERLAKERG